jgi:hypothetical protein
LRTDPVAREFFTFPFVAEVEGVRELAGFAFFAQSALVMFADQMADTRAFSWWYVVSVRTEGATRTDLPIAGFEVWAERACDFGGLAESWKDRAEIVVEGE